MLDQELLSMDDGVSKIVEADATDVAKEYYRSYSKYVLEYRALPSVEDGLKPVQRRIIYTACQQPKKLMKTAKLAGLVMALHPHGDSSIVGSINDMAHPLNAFPLFNTKGNFGGVGFGASAARYTECYLSEAARLNFCQFVDYADYEVGEIGEMEPSSLPTLIPYCLVRGSEGIAIGLSTKVMPLNLLDLVDYYIDYIKNDGSSKKRIKPDVGYCLIENDDIDEVVKSQRGRLTTSSIVTQISDTTLLIEGLYNKSIDALINKIDKWDKSFINNKVGFRDASSSSLKYVFEIYDQSTSSEDVKENLIWASRCNTTFSRVLEENGCAVYSNLDYIVKRSLECLNRAIDRKISSELDKSTKQLDLYRVLNLCKSKNVFDGISKMTSEDLVRKIVEVSNCSADLAKEIVKKPISYLTRSHDLEEESLESQIKSLKDHDRKKYLISLYKEFRKAILPIYGSRKHSIIKSELLKNPCIKFENDTFKVTDGDGVQFNNYVYFVSDQGYVYRRSVSAIASSDIIVETSHDDKVVGFVTDTSSCIEIKTKFSYGGWIGKLVVDLGSFSYDKKFVNLREDDGECISDVIGHEELTDELSEFVKSKVSRTKFIKEGCND